jgi:positive regulator of sigma E activity
MANLEVRRETGTSMMFLGLMVWVADLLVLFFLPAAVKQGRQELFSSIMIILFLLGTYLTVTGYLQRRSAGSEE